MFPSRRAGDPIPEQQTGTACTQPKLRSEARARRRQGFDERASRGTQPRAGAARTGSSRRGASPVLQRSEARARRRQGADVSVLAAGPRSHPTAPVGVAGSRAALSRPPAPVGVPGSCGTPSRPRGPRPCHRLSVLSSRSRHRSGSLRTTRHQPTCVQLTTRSSAAAADDKRAPPSSPGLPDGGAR